MSDTKKEILFKCTRKGCGFATSEAYNYCPVCGLALYVFVDGEWSRSALNVLGPASVCCMAPECSCLENYTVDCEQGGLPQKCLATLASMVEGVRHESRLVRAALEEAGLLPVRAPDSHVAEPVSGRKNASRKAQSRRAV